MSYSPTLGQFLECDPIGYDDGMNPYQFVRSNPARWHDPTGLETDLNPNGPTPPLSANGKRYTMPELPIGTTPTWMYAFFTGDAGWTNGGQMGDFKYDRSPARTTDILELNEDVITRVKSLPDVANWKPSLLNQIWLDVKAKIVPKLKPGDEESFEHQRSTFIQAPMSEPGLRVTLSGFTIYWKATGLVKCNGNGKPAEGITYITYTIYDLYDFKANNSSSLLEHIASIPGWFGTEYHVTGSWSEVKLLPPSANK